LSGTYAAWDVGDYEHLNPKTPAVQDLWRSTMSVGGCQKNGALAHHETERNVRDHPTVAADADLSNLVTYLRLNGLEPTGGWF